MTADSHARRLERNVRLYPWYAAIFNAYFWVPVFFLFFNEHLTLARVLELEAIYYLSVVVLEVPSGYFSDRVGRRATLAIAAVALVVSYTLFALADTFALFAAAQVCLAAGMAFNSGTDTSFLYDSLAGLGREDEYGAVEARVARNVFVAGAVAALAGGFVGWWNLRWAYVLSLGGAALLVGIVVLFVDPGATKRDAAESGFGRQVAACTRLLRQGPLRWLFLFMVLMTVLNHVPWEFYQPYLRLLAMEHDWPDTSSGPLAGMHAFLTLLIGSWFAARSVRIRDRIGTAPALLLAGVLQGVLILSMGLVVAAPIAVLILLRSTPRALMTAPLNVATSPRVDAGHRATWYSLQSLAGRLCFAGTLVGLARIGGEAASADAASLSRMLLIVATAASAGLMLLLVMIPRGLRRADESPAGT